jgi:hypothetical protein
MCPTTATDEQSVSRQDLTLWIEQYHDGSITEDAARQLGALIHARDEVAGWIVQELEFAGLLAQALHDVDRESFVRAFVERLASERGDDDKQARVIARSATAQVQAARLEQSRPPSLGEYLASMASGIASQFTAATGNEERRKVRTGRVAVLVLILAGVTAGAAWVFLVPASVGSLEEFSNGVVILRGNARLLPADDMGLRVGDAVSVPRGGTAKARCGDYSEITLHDDASAELGVIDGNVPHVNLVRGRLTLESLPKSPDGITVSTPHARILLTAGVAAITATTSSTRIENGSATASLTRLGDATQLDLPAEHHAIIGPGAPLEAVPNN